MQVNISRFLEPKNKQIGDTDTITWFESAP